MNHPEVLIIKLILTMYMIVVLFQLSIIVHTVLVFSFLVDLLEWIVALSPGHSHVFNVTWEWPGDEANG